MKDNKIFDKKVSICIPSYKYANLLARCLDSIAIQTFTDFEIVISDDSSDDEIKNLITHYPNLPILYHKNSIPLGSPENWNNAMRLATGEYIKIMHHDDWFAYPDSLDKYVKLMELHPNAVFGFSACIDKNLITHKDILHRANWLQLHYLHKNPDILGLSNFVGSPSTTIFRNKLNLFFDTELIWLVDIEFYIRILRQHSSFSYISIPLVFIGVHENQITNSCIKNEPLILKENDYFHNKLNLKYEKSYFIYCRFGKKIKKILNTLYSKIIRHEKSM